MSTLTDTILAVSSPAGRSARGLVRMSGPVAFEVLDSLVAPAPAEAQRVSRARLRCPNLPVWCVRFAAPHSYTGDDLAELQLPGNPALLECQLQRGCAAGARLAEPGEFTFRAFVRGRLDLTQAEGVAATIAATSDAQLRAAAVLRGGDLGRLAAALADRLAEALALVEAGIDFTDQEDVSAISPGELHARLSRLAADLSDVLARARPWKSVESLPWVVLAGAPSSGKSTLFNALLGHRRAVIAAEPGTTRDVLAEPLQLSDPDGRTIEIMLVDIAGLDTPAAALDRMAQDAARAALGRADLILQLNQPHAAHAAPVIHVRSKADQRDFDLDQRHGGFDIAVSARTGQGLAALTRLIGHRLHDRGTSLAGDLLALQPRHESAFRDAAASIEAVRQRLGPCRLSPALADAEEVAASLRVALDALTSLTGRITPDDILGRIFATFCVGK